MGYLQENWQKGVFMNRQLTPVKAIRAKCLDCTAGQYKEVRFCPITDCPLYPYRMGRRPKNTLNKYDRP